MAIRDGEEEEEDEDGVCKPYIAESNIVVSYDGHSKTSVLHSLASYIVPLSVAMNVGS